MYVRVRTNRNFRIRSNAGTNRANKVIIDVSAMRKVRNAEDPKIVKAIAKMGHTIYIMGVIKNWPINRMTFCMANLPGLRINHN
jgi:hypothetical protein